MSKFNETDFERFCGEVELVLTGQDPAKISDEKLEQIGQDFLKEFHQTHQPGPDIARQLGSNALIKPMFPQTFKPAG